ncbi:MAG: Hpt domain-containing protein, partial [Desulfobulbaceae bacterium]|nr:Hpt domain-containing protein [Desulfobulbaceae bacterium]
MNDPEQLEILEEFISEVRDLLEELEPEIINLGAVSDKEGPLSNETIDKLHAIFRLFHSIKGSAGFLQFNTIVKVSHAAETLLDLLRTGQIRLISNHVDLLCQSCDFTREALDFLEKNLSDKGMETSSQDLIADLKKAVDSPPADEQETLPETEQAEQPEEPEKQEESPPEQEQPLPKIDLELSTEQLITPETVNHFLQEADDLFQEIEQDLLAWSDTPQDMKPVDRLFRNIHSFKGNCGFLGLTDLEKLSHKIETILSEAINDNAINKDKLPDMLLQLVDTFKVTLNSLAEESSAEIDGLSLYLELLDDFLPKQDRQEESTSTKLGDILVEQGAVVENDVEQALEIQNKPIGEILVESGITTE